MKKSLFIDENGNASETTNIDTDFTEEVEPRKHTEEELKEMLTCGRCGQFQSHSSDCPNNPFQLMERRLYGFHSSF
jgi:hypothetical protein